MSQTEAQPQPLTPSDRSGGREVFARIVDRFYDLMDSERDYAALRAMHAADLGPMRKSLTGYLTAWAGGPNDWHDERPGACIMSMHRDLAGMSSKTGDQWMAAMQRAAEEIVPDDPELVTSFINALSRMANAMVNSNR